MIARHPLAASTLPATAVTWVKLGWVTLVAGGHNRRRHADRWRWFWPVSFSRWVGRPARGKWRTWCYRRRWAAVMTIAGVAPWYQGRTILPVLGKGHRHPAGVDRVHVRLVSGQSARADFAECADNLAHGFGATPVPGPHARVRARWCWSSSAVTPWPPRPHATPHPPTPDLKALPVGRREDGLPWLVKLHGTHVLMRAPPGRARPRCCGAGPGQCSRSCKTAGPHPAADPEADGTGLRPGHLRLLRRLCADVTAIAAMLDRR
jgi:S-DNA-T family DNA segregation ATPase FtsK/SpoIIIE